jgi:hypothetical protein
MPKPLASGLLQFPHVERVLLTYSTTLATPGGRTYRPRACGRERPDGTWEGWLEFLPDDATPILRSERETSQPNLVDLEYWATGVTPVYLEGALERTLTPAPRHANLGAAGPPVSAPVLDPFVAFEKGELHLWTQLRGRSPRYLHQIIRTYRLASDGDSVDAMSTEQLTAFIIAAVRTRPAA